MSQYIANTTAQSQAQEMYDSGNRANDNPLVFGYPKEGGANRDYRTAYRWQPGLSYPNGGHIIIIESAYVRLTRNTEGAGAFTSGVHVHDGSAPDLTSNDLAFGYTDIGDSQDWSIASSWTADTEYTSPDMVLAVQAWYDTYTSTDWIGLIVDGGDSASEEWKGVYNGDYATASYRPELEINYKWRFGYDVNFVANADIDTVFYGAEKEDVEWVI